MADSAISDNQPAPWVMCPECASVWHRIEATLERGDWTDEDTYVMRESFEGPKVGGFVSSRSHGDKPIECVECGHRFDISDVGFKIDGGYGDGDD